MILQLIHDFIIIAYIIALLYFNSKIAKTYANTIYTVDNVEAVYSPDDISKISMWAGEPNTVGDDMSREYPHVTRIDTYENTLNQSGYVNHGENFIILYRGSLTANNITLTRPGEVFWTALDNHVSIYMSTYSSAFIIGAKYDPAPGNKYVETVPRSVEEKERGFLYSGVDEVAHDEVITDGVAGNAGYTGKAVDAVDYMWGATAYTPPLVIVELWTEIGHISAHQHPKGVVYLPLENCRICYCYDDDDANCLCTNDGEVRHEYAGRIYREIVSVVSPTGLEAGVAGSNLSCKFAVLEFYPFQSGGLPQFYSSYDALNGSMAISPLRLKTVY
jgi:hypothetical protein